MNSKIKVKYPIAIEWNITEARLQKARNSINPFLGSATFYIPDTDVNYCLEIHPNGNNDATRGKTCVFFYLVLKKEIEAELTISFETVNFTRKPEHVIRKLWTMKCSPCTVDELFDPEKRFIVDGELTIKFEGFLMIERYEKLCKLESSGNNLCVDLWNQQNKDFTIVADGKEISAHKCILSTRSPVFAAMFQPHTKEAQENKVIIPDFPFGVVETGIKLCYDSRLVKNIPTDDQILLFQFFDKYDIQSLKTDLENYMITVVDESNVCRLANCSLLSNASNLKEKCGEFLQKCYRANQLVTDFDILDKEFAYEVLKNSFFKIVT